MSDLHGWATFIGSHLTREPTASSVLTKWWNSELILAASFDSLRQMVTKVWFCTRLFKLWSPNLDQMCKTTWLRSFFFFFFLGGGGGGGGGGGVRAIDLDFQGQFELKTSKVYPIFSNSNIHPINHPQLGPSALAVPEQLSNGGGKNVGHSPAESGTDFWALCTTSATLWPL